jgi:thiamine biosynthesis lipoprotein
MALALWGLGFLAGCSSTKQTTQIRGKTMGTTYHISYVALAGAKGPTAAGIDKLLAEISDSLSTYIESSVISRINASLDTGAWHPVDNHFSTVFQKSREIYKDTAGAFNPAVGPLVQAWGFGPNGAEALPDDAAIQRLLKLAFFDAFEFRESPGAVRKPFPGCQLDFNAIAEGYAIDAIASLLEQDGLHDYLIELGGEVRARGRRSDGTTWTVAIEKPPADALALATFQAVLSLEDAALATSGVYRNIAAVDDTKISHILDPRTGYPARNSLLSVSVLAKDAMTADAYATALMVMGLEDALRFVNDRDQLEAYLIATDEAGNIIAKSSSGFPETRPAQ